MPYTAKSRRSTKPGAFFYTVCAAFVSVLTMGCPPNSPPADPDPPSVSVVDLAVGDWGSPVSKGGPDDGFENSQVLLYFDVLNGDDDQNPDVVVEGDAVSGLERPVAVFLTESDLYAANYTTNNVMIWRDYRTMSDNQAPDVVLDNSLALVALPIDLLVTNNALFVANQGGTVNVYEDAAGISANTAPDLQLTDASQIGQIAAGNGWLFVSEPASNGSVFGYEIDNILSKGPVSADVELEGDSFLNLGDTVTLRPIGLEVARNHLFVTDNATGRLFVFSPANGLTDSQPPDVAINSSTGLLYNSMDVEVVGTTSFVGNLNGAFFNYPGVVGFHGATTLSSPKNPEIVIANENAALGGVFDMTSVGNALFVAANDGVNALSGDVHIFLGADAMPFGRPANIVLPSLLDFLQPLSVAVNDRLPGV